jgi:DNA polymerase-4
LASKPARISKKFSYDNLVHYFGKVGSYYYHIAHGRDDRPVQPDRVSENPMARKPPLNADIDDTNQMMDILDDLARRVMEGLRREDRQGLTLTLKVKYHDFQSVTRSVTFPEPICDIDVIMENVKRLLANTEAGNKKVRLLGISVLILWGLKRKLMVGYSCRCLLVSRDEEGPAIVMIRYCLT